MTCHPHILICEIDQFRGEKSLIKIIDLFLKICGPDLARETDPQHRLQTFPLQNFD